MSTLAGLSIILVALLTGGCWAGVVLGVDAVVGGVGIFQRWEDRQAQKDQTAEIKALREEIAATRLRPHASYICRHETVVYDVNGKLWNATICSPVD